MKKIMSLLLVGIMMLSLVACGKDGGKNGGELNVGVFYYTCHRRDKSTMTA